MGTGNQIVRSLKEHEEITLIGMEAAIPDIIALVLRAGKLGIGYQGMRTDAHIPHVMDQREAQIVSLMQVF